jgi:hypothetical protein
MANSWIKERAEALRQRERDEEILLRKAQVREQEGPKFLKAISDHVERDVAEAQAEGFEGMACCYHPESSFTVVKNSAPGFRLEASFNGLSINLKYTFIYARDKTQQKDSELDVHTDLDGNFEVTKDGKRTSDPCDISRLILVDVIDYLIEPK